MNGDRELEWLRREGRIVIVGAEQREHVARAVAACPVQAILVEGLDETVGVSAASGEEASRER